ncbi:MAG: class I tRNA ligase family protein, partial [Clostridia bacterium]|nr:class I tRNA ligase family protein [Clostridia bacterium]
VIDQYGADALRFTLATGNSPGNDMRFSDEKVNASRNFANKLWNASRFTLMNLTIDKVVLPEASKLKAEDKWILSKLNTLIGEVTANLDKFELGVALSKLYDFVWDVLCDWYIELIKPRLNEGDTDAQNVLCYALGETLKLLHPFMPFITEEIYQAIPHNSESIMIAEYPKYSAALEFPTEEAQMAKIIEAITLIRNRRAEMNVAPSKKAKVIIVTADRASYSDDTVKFFQKLASASDVEFVDSYADDNAVQIVAAGATIFIPLGELIDFAKERERLMKEREKYVSEIDRVEKKLANEGFVSKAPAQLIEAEKAKKEKFIEQLAAVDAAIAKLG